VIARDELVAAYADEFATVYQGDVREVLARLPAESVQCVVTSPPYWGLRDYGTATWDGGDAECDHLGPPRMSGKTTLSHPELKSRAQLLAEPSRNVPTPYAGTCGKCGARRIDSQLGLEATPQEYVASMVEVFREVRRVLRKDGTLWINLGDSYASAGGTGDTTSGFNERYFGGGSREGKQGQINAQRPMRARGNLKPKDLVGIPWRVAFALQEDGWYLRSDIIWSKPNPMPESVTDRPTKAHEYLFLLTKGPTYYYDADAIRETGNPAGRNKRTVWEIATQPYPEAHFATYPEALIEPCIKAGAPLGGVVLDPFAGSGTTLAVSKRLGRHSVGVELNPAYIALIRKRVSREVYQPELEF